jgi:hypothetical protein
LAVNSSSASVTIRQIVFADGLICAERMLPAEIHSQLDRAAGAAIGAAGTKLKNCWIWRKIYAASG